MAKVADFLEKVSSDEAFEKEFDRNPKKVMDEFGLTPQQQDLIRDGHREEDPRSDQGRARQGRHRHHGQDALAGWLRIP